MPLNPCAWRAPRGAGGRRVVFWAARRGSSVQGSASRGGPWDGAGRGWPARRVQIGWGFGCRLPHTPRGCCEGGVSVRLRPGLGRGCAHTSRAFPIVPQPTRGRTGGYAPGPPRPAPPLPQVARYPHIRPFGSHRRRARAHVPAHKRRLLARRRGGPTCGIYAGVQPPNPLGQETVSCLPGVYLPFGLWTGAAFFGGGFGSGLCPRFGRWLYPSLTDFAGGALPFVIGRLLVPSFLKSYALYLGAVQEDAMTSHRLVSLFAITISYRRDLRNEQEWSLGVVI